MKEDKKKLSIIAEIGTSHGGDIGRAKELVDAAVAVGADYAKFQIVYADEILHPDTGFVHLPGGDVRLYDRFKDLEVNTSFYEKISDYCTLQGILFLCTPFGIKSARELQRLKPVSIKIASPELNHFPLLKEVASYGVPLILSSGVSLLSDIEKALAATEAAKSRILLHCITSYPAPEEEYNLNVIESLASVFGIPVGVSDHSLDPVLVPVLAVACGACMIEKHITLSRSNSGLDDPVALTPELFSQMVQTVRIFEEKPKEIIVKAMEESYGKERITAILGSGKKTLAHSERENYLRTNRSIHYLKDMSAGMTIRDEDIALLRTEKVLSPGIAPEFLDTVIGRSLVRTVENGAGVHWDDLLSRPAPLST